MIYTATCPACEGDGCPQCDGGEIVVDNERPSPPPDEGETNAVIRQFGGCGQQYVDGGREVICVRPAGHDPAEHRATPPVVPVQPEETDTVNDEGAADRLAREHGHDNAQMMREMLLHAHHFGDLTGECADIALDLLNRFATSSAVGAEVRVEWGVRYRWLATSWEPGRMRSERHPTEVQARQVAEHLATHPEYADVEIGYMRTTSAWVPVTDEQDKEQKR